MIFDPDVDTVKKGPWLVFSMVLFFGMFGPTEIPYYWFGYFVVLGLCFGAVIFLVGGCESYLVFVVAMFLSVFGVLCFFLSSMLYFFVSNIFGGGLKALVVALSPMLLVSAMVVSAMASKSKIFKFDIVGDKVANRTHKREGGKYLGLVIAILTLLSGGLLKAIGPFYSGLVVTVAATLGCTAIVFHFRHTIRGLRTLRIQEQYTSTPYTFMQIEKIREARRRWWMGRLFKWIASLHKSPV
jgi:hypothetical protein